MSIFRSTMCLVVLSAAATRVDAALISISSDSANSTEKLGFFTGTINYTFTSATAAQLAITLKNTSPLANGGKITAIAFDLPTGITGVSLSTDSNLTNLIGGPSYSSSIPAPPFGSFDVGASLTLDWLGGGSPNPGIAVNSIKTFTFSFTGTGLDQLTTNSFVNELTSGEFLLVRYRGFVDGGSDKVPTNVVVPEVPSMLLSVIGMGGIGMMFVRRFRAC